MAVRIIDRGRGPEVEGTRVTVYRIMDFLREGSATSRIAAELDLTEEQVGAALDYIATHQQAVEAVYAQILRRVQQPNPPSVTAAQAPSSDVLQQRISARQTRDVTHADSGR